MSKKTSLPDDFPEISAADLAGASYRVGMKEVNREEWQAAVQEKTAKKQRVNIMLDAQVISWFKSLAGDRGYQTLINQTLRQAMDRSDLEQTLRKVIREELKKAA